MLNVFGALSMKSVPHVLENIFFSLDYKSFKTCMKVNKTWRKLLSTASYQRRLEELLIEKKENEKKLYDASKEGNTEVVRKLISHLRVDVNFVVLKSWYKTTPLSVAVSKGHKEVVNILLDAGALTTTTVGYGYFPLHLAAYHGHIDIVTLLLDSGAEVDKANYDSGRTPLHLAASEGYEEVLKLLLAGGAEVDKANNDKSTPLMNAAGNGNLEVVQILLNFGASIDKADKWKRTPLRLALTHGHKDVGKLLLEQGADPNEADDDGETILHMVTYLAGYHSGPEVPDLIKLLIEGGADPNRRNKNGRTPLQEATLRGHTDAVKDLLKGGT